MADEQETMMKKTRSTMIGTTDKIAKSANAPHYGNRSGVLAKYPNLGTKCVCRCGFQCETIVELTEHYELTHNLTAKVGMNKPHPHKREPVRYVPIPKIDDPDGLNWDDE